MDFKLPNVEDQDRATNLEWNRQRWGQRAGWTELDRYGYCWNGNQPQQLGQISSFADEYLRPHTGGRYDLKILEISPGAGRFTAELLRYAREMCLVDLNQAAIDVCKSRFRFLPTPIRYLTNDGTSLADVPDRDYDAIVSYDSMVHMHPEIIAGYVRQLPPLLAPDGFAWLDHSGKGARELGHRSAMTAEAMAEIAAEAGLRVLEQRFRNDRDCVSVLGHVR